MATKLAVVLAAIAACSGSPPSYAIVGQAGESLTAVAGDALALEVVEVSADGTTKALPASAGVVWTMPITVTTLSPGTIDPADPLPPAGDAPTGVFVINASRGDINDSIQDVVFVLDAGSIGAGKLELGASFDGGDIVTGSIAVTVGPAGDVTRGALTYAINCGECHGMTGDGTPANPDGTYTINNGSYTFPAPGLNNAPGRLGNNPAWNAALLAFASRADATNAAVALRLPMPNWLAPSPTTQDFADIYAYLVATTD